MSDCPPQKEVDAALKVVAKTAAALQKRPPRSKSFNWHVPMKGAELLVIRGSVRFRQAMLEAVAEAVYVYFNPPEEL